MTHMNMRVAMWGQRLALAPYEDDVPQFEDLRLDVLYDSDHGYMLFAPSVDGTPMHYKHHGGIGMHAFEFTLCRIGEDLPPRFALHDVELSVDDEGNMAWDMPSLYDLPWPDHARNMSFEDRTTMAERELALRVDSCDSDPVVLRRVAATVPPWARNIIRAERWIRIFKGSNATCSAA